MLDVALNFLADEFNAFLLRRTGSTTLGRVVPGPIVDEKGNLAIESGRIALTLVNIEEERILREQEPQRILRGGIELKLQPQLKLNLTLLFSARMTDYSTTLKALSNVLYFFQSSPSFSVDDHPSLDPRIGKIVMELYNTPPETLNQLWASVGSKHQPSIWFRARLITIDDQEPSVLGGPIQHIHVLAHDR